MTAKRKQPGAAALQSCISGKECSAAELLDLPAGKYRNIYHAYFNEASDGFLIIDADTDEIIDCNPAFEKLTGRNVNELRSLHVRDLMPQEQLETARGKLFEIREKGSGVPFELDYLRPGGGAVSMEFISSVPEVGGKKVQMSAVRDITDRKQREEALRKSEELYRNIYEEYLRIANEDLEAKVRERTAELEKLNASLRESEETLSKQKIELEQKNIALGEIIKQVDIEREKLKNDIAVNIEKILLPIFSKIRLEEGSLKYGDMLQHYLENMLSSFGRKMTLDRYGLTTREIEICTMIRAGLTTKEISGLLNISGQTIEKHRKNIRKKFGITSTKVNLTTFMDTF